MATIAGNGERIARLEERMENVEEQLGNFKEFRKFMQDFATRSDERAKHRAEKEAEDKAEADKKDAKRAAMHYWWLGLLSAAIITMLGAFFNWTHDFEKRHHVSESTISQPAATHAKEE